MVWLLEDKLLVPVALLLLMRGEGLEAGDMPLNDGLFVGLALGPSWSENEELRDGRSMAIPVARIAIPLVCNELFPSMFKPNWLPGGPLASDKSTLPNRRSVRDPSLSSVPPPSFNAAAYEAPVVTLGRGCPCTPMFIPNTVCESE